METIMSMSISILIIAFTLGIAGVVVIGVVWLGKRVLRKKSDG